MTSTVADDSLRAQLLWMLELDAHLEDWAIPDATPRPEETR